MVYTHSVSKLALGAVLSASLLFGGCKDKDANNPKKASNAIVKVETRKVNEAEAQKALQALSLAESGSGNFQWADKSGSAGNYVYTDVTLKGEKGKPLHVGKMEIKGVHMQDEKAVFDKAAFYDMNIEDDDAVVKIDKLTLIKPSPTLANELARAFSGDENAFENVEGDISFGGFELAGLDVKADDGNMKLKNLEFGEAKDKTGVFTLSSLEFDGQGKGDNVKFSLDSVQVHGANIQKYKGLFSAAMKESKEGKVSEDAMKQFMSGMNPYDPDFKDFSIRGLHIAGDGMQIKLDSYEGKADRKGDKIYMSTKMSPLTIAPSKDTKNKDIQKMAEALETLGYESLDFTMGGTSVIDAANDNMKSDDTYLELKDGFRLSYNYDLDGYKAFVQKMMEASTNGEKANPMAAMGAMNTLRVNRVKLSLRDDSIIDRAFKFAAKEQGSSVDQLKQQAKMGLAFAGMMAKDEAQQKLATELAGAVTKLIDDGGTLVIDMNPKEPVDMGALMAGGMGGGNFDVSKLGITITHE